MKNNKRTSISDATKRAAREYARRARAAGENVTLDFSGNGPIISSFEPCQVVEVEGKRVTIHNHAPEEPCHKR